MDQHRVQNRDRTCLVEDGKLALVLHDGRTLKGTVKKLELYQFEFEEDGRPPETIHKLMVMYAYAPGEWKGVKKGIKHDKDKKPAGPEVAPAPRPQDRYSCSDKRLFQYLDRRTEIAVTLLDGDVLRGTITWFGRYEFGLKLRTDAEITVFRHALKDASPATG
jgi:sRNA-binding regulator protein Hfq